METLKYPACTVGWGSAALSQLAFPWEGNPNFPREKSHWDISVVNSKVKVKKKLISAWKGNEGGGGEREKVETEARGRKEDCTPFGLHANCIL